MRKQTRAGLCAVLAAAALGGCGGGDGGKPRERSRLDPPADLERETPARPRPAAAGAEVRRGARFRLERIGSFSQPVGIAQPPGERQRLYVIERTGRVRVIRAGKKLRRPLLSVRGNVSLATEQGLLGLAFPPDHARSRLLYYSYTDERGTLKIVEARRPRSRPDRIARGSRRLVLAVRQPRPTHNGGHLLFGPDGYLYAGLGDGGGPGDPQRAGQDRRTLLGKIIRIDPRRHGRSPYRSARSNPFVRARHKRREIFVIGVRNPWRFSFHPRTRALIVGDVGQERWEELDYVPRRLQRGANLGWSAWEGPARFNPRVKARRHLRPVHAYTHGRRCSITAGPAVFDPGVPALRARILYGDFCDGEIRSLRIRNGRATGRRLEHVRVPLLAAFGEDSQRRVYAVSLNGGVYRLAARR